MRGNWLRISLLSLILAPAFQNIAQAKIYYFCPNYNFPFFVPITAEFPINKKISFFSLPKQ